MVFFPPDHSARKEEGTPAAPISVFIPASSKGSVNQRAVRSHRADLVAAIYAGDARVIGG